MDLGLDDDVGPHVFAPTYDRLLTEGGGKVLWEDPQVPISLWLEPKVGAEQCSASVICE